MRRTATRICAATAVALAAVLVAGCGQDDTGEFKSYSELENGQPVAGADDASPATDDSAATGVAADGPADGEKASNSESLPADGAIAAPTPPPSGDGVSSSGDKDSASATEQAALAACSTVGLAAADFPVEAPRPPSPPREIKLLVPHANFRVEGPEGALRISYDDIDLLKVLNMDPVPSNAAEYMPEWLKELDGTRIRIRGFMFPPFQTEGIRHFVLARDNQICCFGRDPKRYDVIDVVMRDGTTTHHIANRPFDVVGVFHISPEADEGGLYQLYVIDDAVVIER
ncbi:MAG: hypothetical protein KY476_02975 [Planctomycetes bacterium]|nr:hypothetical protein [Planctomycetota bacterium]